MPIPPYVRALPSLLCASAAGAQAPGSSCRDTLSASALRRVPVYLTPALTALLGDAIGNVVLRFVVDSTGRVRPGSVTHVWPRARPRLEGCLAEVYRSLVQAATQGLLTSGYVPATIGGCPVPRLVTRRMEWRFTP